MSDQCKFCDRAGNLAQCERTQCSYWQSWMPLELKKQLAAAQAENAEMKKTMWQDGDIVRKENATLRAKLAESDARCKAAETVLGRLGWDRTAAGWRDSRAPDSCTGCGNEYLHNWKGEV